MEVLKKDEKTTIKKGKIPKGSKDKLESQKISFDAYFRMLVSKDNSVLPHHKAPMKSWIIGKGLENATIEEFERILKKY